MFDKGQWVRLIVNKDSPWNGKIGVIIDVRKKNKYPYWISMQPEPGIQMPSFIVAAVDNVVHYMNHPVSEPIEHTYPWYTCYWRDKPQEEDNG